MSSWRGSFLKPGGVCVTVVFLGDSIQVLRGEWKLYI